MSKEASLTWSAVHSKSDWEQQQKHQVSLLFVLIILNANQNTLESCLFHLVSLLWEPFAESKTGCSLGANSHTLLGTLTTHTVVVFSFFPLILHSQRTNKSIKTKAVPTSFRTSGTCQKSLTRNNTSIGNWWKLRRWKGPERQHYSNRWKGSPINSQVLHSVDQKWKIYIPSKENNITVLIYIYIIL